MQVIDNERVVCVDVDDTLVIWDVPNDKMHQTVCLDNFGTLVDLLPCEENIKLLKAFKARGWYVIVWSQAGPVWITEVLRGLKLEQFVDLVLEKPRWIVDDLPASAWTERACYNNEAEGEVKKVDFTDYEDDNGDES